MTKTIFLDRDGVLVREPLFDPAIGSASEAIDTWEKFEILPDVANAFKKLKGAGYQILIITNQDGIDDGFIKPDIYEEMNKKLLLFVEENGGEKIEKIYTCPHSAGGTCNCRKPKRGLIDEALKDYPEIDLSRSWFVGDRTTDIELGKLIGARTVFLQASHDLQKGLFPESIVTNLEGAVDFI